MLFPVMVIFICVDANFNKPFKSDLGKYAIYSFVNSMVEKKSLRS